MQRMMESQREGMIFWAHAALAVICVIGLRCKVAMIMKKGLGVSLWVLLGACATHQGQYSNLTRFDRKLIPSSLAMDTDAADPGAPARPGDRMLFAIQQISSGVETTRFVRVSLVEIVSLEETKSSFETHDLHLNYNLKWSFVDGVILIESFGPFGRILSVSKQDARILFTVNQDALIANAPRMFNPILDVVRETPELNSLFLDAVRVPSSLSVALSGGLRVNLGLDMSGCRLHDDMSSLDVYSDNIDLTINGEEALEIQTFHTWRQSPFLLSAGVIRLIGQHPTDPGRRILVEVVGAERGPKAAL